MPRVHLELPALKDSDRLVLKRLLRTTHSLCGSASSHRACLCATAASQKGPTQYTEADSQLESLGITHAPHIIMYGSPLPLALKLWHLAQRRSDRLAIEPSHPKALHGPNKWHRKHM